MARRRFRRRDLKRPDEFVSRGQELLLWARDNGRLLAQIGAGVAVVAVVAAGFVSVRGARTRQANDDLTRALGQFRAGNYSQAATELADVASRWQSTNAGRIAKLYAANADLKANNFESAASLLQDVLASGQWPPYLRQQALVTLALALERKGDTQEAAARYAEAAALEGPYAPQAVLGEARCREQSGDKEAARKLYERFVRDFPQAPDSEVISAKVDGLES
jgi:outer membrane protein assembly factor BamD (BamD/ComL family)